MNITAEQLAQIAIYAKVARFTPFVAGINDTMRLYEINTPMRAAHFLAQCMHECGEYRYSEELASGEAYEGRKDLGNIHPGDGKKFKGHGDIQCTGRSNHARYTAFRKTKGECPDFEQDPHALTQTPWRHDVAGWFWHIEKHLNLLADADNVEGITRKVNGGLNGLDDRKKYLARAKSVLKVV